METVLGHDFHSSVQELLNIHQQRTERETRSLGGQRHQQINIAGIISIAPCHGPEHAHLPDAVTLGDGENLGAVSFDHGVHRNRVPTLRPASA